MRWDFHWLLSLRYKITSQRSLLWENEMEILKTWNDLVFYKKSVGCKRWHFFICCPLFCIFLICFRKVHIKHSTDMVGPRSAVERPLDASCLLPSASYSGSPGSANFTSMFTWRILLLVCCSWEWDVCLFSLFYSFLAVFLLVTVSFWMSKCLMVLEDSVSWENFLLFQYFRLIQ